MQVLKKAQPLLELVEALVQVLLLALLVPRLPMQVWLQSLTLQESALYQHRVVHQVTSQTLRLSSGHRLQTSPKLEQQEELAVEEASNPHLSGCYPHHAVRPITFRIRRQ